MEADTDLRAVLERSRALGLLGPGDIGEHISHATAYVPLLDGASRVLDLGTGGGVPGLVLARALAATQFVLVDAGERRVAFLRSAVRSLGLSDRVTVVLGRAEILARHQGLREQFDHVVSRSFGGPAVTAECAVGFMSPTGRLFVSEPADRRERWPSDGLAEIGLRSVELHRAEHAAIQELARDGSTVDAWPRGVGIPTRQPVFGDR